MESFEKIAEHLGTYSHDMLLGRLAWYSVPETKVNHANFVVGLHDFKLDQYFLPPPPRPSDVFRRACTANQKKHKAGGGIKTNHIIKEVGKDKDFIWRQLIREKIDTNGHRIAFQPMIELLFDRKAESISTETLPQPDEEQPGPAENQIIEAIQNYFDEETNSLTSYAIRQAIVKILQRFSATVVRPSGGVYFVSEYYFDELTALESLINSVGSCSFHTLPLLDDKKQREMLKKSFEDESVELVDRSLEEIRKIMVENQTISSEKYASYFTDHKMLMEKTKEYASLLEEQMDLTSARLEVYQEQIYNLLERVV